MRDKDVIQKNWRMWKSGKQWLYASSALLAVTMGLGLSATTAHAQDGTTASEPATTGMQSIAQSDSTTNRTGTASAAAATEANTGATTTDETADTTTDTTTTGTDKTTTTPATTETTPATPAKTVKADTPSALKRATSTSEPAATTQQKPQSASATPTKSMVTPTDTAKTVASIKDSTKVVIHYAGDGSKWVPYVWGLKPNGDGQQYDWTGTDSYGSYANIDLDQNYQQVGVLIKGVASWDKDGTGANRAVNVDDSGKAEVWYQAGSDDAQTVTPTFDGAVFNVHYHDKDSDNVTSYKVWTDKSGEAAAQTVKFDDKDDYGNRLSSVTLKDQGFSNVFVQTLGDDQATREFTPLPGQNATDIYLVANDQTAYYTASAAVGQELVTSAAMDTLNQLTVSIGTKLTALQAQQQLTLSNNGIKTIAAVAPDANGLSKTFTITTTKDIDIMQANTVSFDGNAKAIDIGNYVRSSAFDDKYYYGGDDLGATYTENRTQIKLWAPTANQVELRIYDSVDNDATPTKVIKMQRGDKGVWTSVLNGNYQGWAYDYQLNFGDGTQTTTDDPYSKAVTVNGDRSVIEDVNQIKPTDFNRMPDFGNATNAVIYETSVRDFTKDPNSGVTDKGKFLGMVQTGTHTASGQVTGIDYLKDLGVTHVQLMPMYDFASIDETSADPSYNWGYDPKNYDVPEGSYATDASDPTNRIMEMKEMINGFHKNGILVVMDVVYNHVYSPAEQAFQKVVPGYYFQYDAEGHLTNGSGVGNDVASERKMVRKYIVDSVKYWATNYNIDGFRFDLMGILDVETMNEIRAELNAIDPGILVYGEGWDMRATNHDLGAAQYNADKVDKNVGFFSDDIRNAIKGATFGGISKGLVEGNTQEENYDQHAQAFVDGFLGGQNYANATTAHPYQAPTQTINYVACHDNRTLYDMLTALMPEESEANLVKRDKLATSMAFLAEGVPFVNAGQEALRTKGGDENSYQSPDSVNQIDWNRVQDNQDLVNYFKQLVNLRKNESVFRLDNYNAVAKQVKVLQAGQDGVFAFEYDAGGHKLYVFFNVNDRAVDFNGLDLTNARVQLSSEAAQKLGGVTSLAALSTLVVREDLPQTVTINYCDQNNMVMHTEVITLTHAGDQYQLVAPTGYHLVNGPQTVAYDEDAATTTRSLMVMIEKDAAGNPGNETGNQGDSDNNGSTDQPGTGTDTSNANAGSGEVTTGSGDTVQVKNGQSLTGTTATKLDYRTDTSAVETTANKTSLTSHKVQPAKAAATTTSSVLPQTDERSGQTASLFGLVAAMLASLIGWFSPKRKRN